MGLVIFQNEHKKNSRTKILIFHVMLLLLQCFKQFGTYGHPKFCELIFNIFIFKLYLFFYQIFSWNSKTYVISARYSEAAMFELIL